MVNQNIHGKSRREFISGNFVGQDANQKENYKKENPKHSNKTDLFTVTLRKNMNPAIKSPAR